MQPEPRNHPTVDASVGESATGTATRRLRASLECVFQDVRVQSADLSPDPELRTALRLVCVDARRSGLRAEQLLVMIKDVWAALPAGISRVQSVHGDERLNHVISTCVDEYYDSVGEGSGDATEGQREAEP